jgi:UDP-N-acetyl-2-amino-2-deoxyglucuronate dehydrogenase
VWAENLHALAPRKRISAAGLLAAAAPPMKKYNVGVLGYGWASEAHIAALNATSWAQVTALYSSRPHDAHALSQRHGCSLQVFRDLDALLTRDDIHAVSICSYPRLHATQAIAAARAGKHIIIEKPIALTIEETRAVAQAVAASGVRACVCFEGRFSAQFIATKALIESGLLGTIHYGEFDYFHGIGPWYRQFRWNTRRDGGGTSLLSAGCHALSSMLLCMGNDVETVSSFDAQSASPIYQPYEYATTSVTIVTFRGGRIGKVASVIDCLQPYYRHTHLVGSDGALLDNQFHSRRLTGLQPKEWSRLAFPVLESGDVKDHPYRAQFEAFFAALDRGEDMPLTNFNEALVTHRVAFAAELSAREHRRVRLEEIADLGCSGSATPDMPRKVNGHDVAPARHVAVTATEPGQSA